VSTRREHPIIQGLVAMGVVGAVIAVVIGGMAFAGAQVLGLNGESAISSDSSGDGASMYLPKPERTDKSGPGPLVSIEPLPGDESSSAAPDTSITLEASPTDTVPMGRVDLSGSYPDGEGVTLVVQKLQGSTWSNFVDIDATVTGGQFHTYIQTGTAGPNKFRMYDAAAGVASNVVTITIG